MKFSHQTKFDTLGDLIVMEHLHEQHIDGLDDRDPHQSWLKSMFRKSEEWRWFCKTLIEDRGGVCERCGGDGHECSGLQVHHKDPRNYTNLKKEKFSVLCGRCHLKIEAYSASETSRKNCPKNDRQFMTLYPYKETDKDVLAKSGGLIKKKWSKELSATKNPKWINVSPMSSIKKAEVKKGVDFMKEHPELFK